MISIGNIEGFTDSASTVFENPANLKQVNSSSFSFFSTTLMEEVTYQNYCAAFRTEYGQFGFGYMSASVTEIPYTMENQNNRFELINYFMYRNELYKFSYQNSFNPNFHYGVSTTFHNVTAADFFNGFGYNFDAGIIYDQENISYSLTAKNFMTSLKTHYTDDQEEEFPFYLIAGIKYKLSEFALLAQVKNASTQDNLMYALGINYSPKLIPYLNFHAGYKEISVLGEVRNNFTVGVGMQLANINYNYAYEKSDHFEFDSKNYFSLGLNF